MNAQYVKSLTIGFLLSLSGLADADGENVLFYNAQTRAAAVGKLDGNSFYTTNFYPAGSFGKWTHIAQVDGQHKLLFYHASTGTGAEGTLDKGAFVNTRSVFFGFELGWTHIVDVHLHQSSVILPLFYDAAFGSGAVGYSPSVSSYPADSFARGWTHIAPTWSGSLFYKAETGEGAITVPTASSSATPGFADALKTVRYYGPQSFSTGWTHLVSDQTNIFFYNASDGSAAIGSISAGSFQTKAYYPAESFLTGWTNIVAAGTKFLFYNRWTGEGAIGEVAGNTFRTTRSYRAGSFSRGWTHIVVTKPDSQPPVSP